MKLTREQIDALLKMLSLTRDEELTCDECAKHLAEFAEKNLEGHSALEGLQAVEHHLELCGECREEFEILMQALRSG